MRLSGASARAWRPMNGWGRAGTRCLSSIPVPSRKFSPMTRMACGSNCLQAASLSRLVEPRNGAGERARRERLEVLDALADADEVHRQPEFLRQRDEDAAAGGAVELG